jgi:DNA-binding transcriptional ArsR family regulator
METVDINAVRSHAVRATSLLKALANEDRILILMHLAQVECDVTQLGEQLQIRQPTLSQQLGVVRRAGLVSARREGKHIYYRTVNAEALKFIALINTLYRRAGILESDKA